MKRTEVLPLVLADLEQRVAKGAAEYGEPLTTHNGRDALQDAYEEALDQALYLRQALEERGAMARCQTCGQRWPLKFLVDRPRKRGLAIHHDHHCPPCAALVDMQYPPPARRSRRT